MLSFFPFFSLKKWKSIFQPAFGVRSNQKLVKLYNNPITLGPTVFDAVGPFCGSMSSNSAARFGDLWPFGLFFEPFGRQYFALATLKCSYFLGYFSKMVIKTCLNMFLAWFSELWCRYFWILEGFWCRSFEIFKLLWCRSFGVFKNLAFFCSNFLAALSSKKSYNILIRL